MNTHFDYDLAFSRNIGWVTSTEQQILKRKKVAIAGLGGVGGSHLLALVRLGITRFNLADFDEFGCENTNRQVGATTASYGKKKLDTMIRMAREINPEIEITGFSEGVTEQNLGEFLADVDCYIDALDFFVLGIRRRVFAQCYDQGIPATTAAPIGMGTAYINFLPGKMSFEQYFDLAGYTESEQYIRFYLGLTPANLQKQALVDPSTVDLANKKGPSTVVGCQLATGVAVAQVAKILLNRGPVICAPRSLHFDAFSNKMKKVWRPGGNRNPLQQLLFKLVRKKLQTPQSDIRLSESVPASNAMTTAEKVIELAKWAPSGDNTQPWRFKLLSDTTFIIYASNTRDHSVYDLDGHSSELAHGMLLEAIDIAASRYHCRAVVNQTATETPEGLADTIHYQVELEQDSNAKPDPLLPYVKTRTVQRRPMGTRALSDEEKAALQQCLPAGFKLHFYESLGQKWRCAWLNFKNAKTRLTMKEAYHVHKEIIDWGQQFSDSKIPEQALGIDKGTGQLMQWAFKKWSRVAFLNRYLFGTLAPRLQLDLLPGICSSAHFTLCAPHPAELKNDYLAAGRAIYRFWLMTDALQLGLQPGLTPVIFSRYLDNDVTFTDDQSVCRRAKAFQRLYKSYIPEHKNLVFMGRVGRTTPPVSRSVRRPLKTLVLSDNPADS